VENPVVEICNQSDYDLLTLSHVACQIITRILISTNKTNLKTIRFVAEASSKRVTFCRRIFTYSCCAF